MPVATKPEPRSGHAALSLWQRFVEALARALAPLLRPIVEEAIVNAMRKGAEPLVAIPAEDYEAYRETVEILEDEEALADLRASDEDERAGRVYDYEDVRRELGLGEAHPHATG